MYSRQTSPLRGAPPPLTLPPAPPAPVISVVPPTRVPVAAVAPAPPVVGGLPVPMWADNPQISPLRKGRSASPGFDKHVNNLIDRHLDLGHPEVYIAQKVSMELYNHKLERMHAAPPTRVHRSLSPAYSRSSLPLASSANPYRVDDPPALDRPRRHAAGPSSITHDAVGSILDAQMDAWAQPRGARNRPAPDAQQQQQQQQQPRTSGAIQRSSDPLRQLVQQITQSGRGTPAAVSSHGNNSVPVSSSHGHSAPVSSGHSSLQNPAPPVSEAAPQSSVHQQPSVHDAQSSIFRQPPSDRPQPSAHQSSAHEPPVAHQSSVHQQPSADTHQPPSGPLSSQHNQPSVHDQPSAQQQPSAHQSSAHQPPSGYPQPPPHQQPSAAGPASSIFQQPSQQEQPQPQPDSQPNAPPQQEEPASMPSVSSQQMYGGGPASPASAGAQSHRTQPPPSAPRPLPPRRPPTPLAYPSGGAVSEDAPAPQRSGAGYGKPSPEPPATGFTSFTGVNPASKHEQPLPGRTVGTHSAMDAGGRPRTSPAGPATRAAGRPGLLPDPPAAPVIPRASPNPPQGRSPSPSRMSPAAASPVRLSPALRPAGTPPQAAQAPLAAYREYQQDTSALVNTPVPAGAGTPYFPESHITLQVRHVDATVIDGRGQPTFPVAHSFEDDVVNNPARAQWQKERMQLLERKRQAHLTNQGYNTGDIHVATMVTSPPRQGRQHMVAPQQARPQYQPTSPQSPGYHHDQPIFASGRLGEPASTLPPASQHPQHPTHSPPRQHSPVGLRQRVVTPAAPVPKHKSVLEEQMEKDKKSAYGMRMDFADASPPPGVSLELPDDSKPIIAPAVVLRAKMMKADWLKHPAAGLVVKLLAMRGLEYGINSEMDARIEAYMTRPVLNAFHWMQIGTYLTKFGREGDPTERYFFLKEIFDPRTGHSVPRLCYGKRADSYSFTTGESITDLVDVHRGSDDAIFDTARVSNGGRAWIKGMRIGNKRRIVSSRGCFSLVFRQSAKDGSTYRSYGLMTLKEDVFTSWVPAFETLRSIVSDVAIKMPRTAVPGKLHFSNGPTPAPAQPARPMSVKLPHHGDGTGPAPPSMLSVKQPPADAAQHNQSVHQNMNRPGTLRLDTPRKKVLLIGVSYERTGTAADSIRRAHTAASNAGNFFLRRDGWERSEVRTLKDSANAGVSSKEYPSRQNILDSLAWLAADPDCHMFLAYCGHGKAFAQSTEDVLVPADHDTAGFISQAELHSALTVALQPNTRLTCLFDVSGGSGPYLSVSDGVVMPPAGSPVAGKLEQHSTQLAGNHSVMSVSGVTGETWPADGVGHLTSSFLTSMSRRNYVPLGTVLEGMGDETLRNGIRQSLQISSTQTLTPETPLDL